MLVNYYLYHNSVIKFNSIIFKYFDYIRCVEEFNDLYNQEESQHFASVVSDIFYSASNSQEDFSPEFIQYKRN